MPPRQPRKFDKRKSSGKSSKKPTRRKKSTFPLDPSHTLQRELDVTSDEKLPLAKLKAFVRHPTVFRKRIASVDDSAQHGDLVRVVSDSGDKIGLGIWNPRAESTIRILKWGDFSITKRDWQQNVARAIRLRHDDLKLTQSTNAYRVIHAEGDGFPGIVADVYGDVLSVEAFSLGMFQRSQAFASLLSRQLKIPHWIVRPGPMTYEQEGFIADGFQSGKVPESVVVTEHGTKFEVHPFEGHKTGYFCDQRDNRQKIREFCKGKSVLDLCCYTGGFAINCALAGAASVTAVDLDEDAIRQARRNAKLNHAAVKFIHADTFSYLRDSIRNKQFFDVVILDPPKLIRSRNEFDDGKQKYYDMNQLASEVVSPDGFLVSCSCSGLLSMTDFTYNVRAATGNRLPQIIMRTQAGADHPVAGNCLESEYLKCLWMKMR
ncbi:class I SAM-dependent rRNA methyltransferase [Thalassoglobus sp. JC818]|uniref:class I SAM-dependent rRNA methyltransferase n=1 Tax=Thalassoglobus sp. JC818 TaxID=3232136 RepID=UPI00345772A5